MMLVCDPWMGHINDMISCIYDSYYEAGNCSDVKRRKEDLQFNIIINFPQHQVLAKLDETVKHSGRSRIVDHTSQMKGSLDHGSLIVELRITDIGLCIMDCGADAV